MPSVEEKYRKLRELLSSYGRVMVALSGGLDSSFLLFAAKEAIGTEKTFAAIGVSPSLPEAEYEEALEFMKEIGLPSTQLISVETNELDNPDYSKNPPNRCFFCKSELFSKLAELATRMNIDTVCDGSNASDVGDHRPGMIAGSNFKIKSPLLEAGLTKDEIRELAQRFKLSVWNKAQSACLASRIPYNSDVTAEKLAQIEAAEVYLKSLGFRQLRVRHHGNLARIELPIEDVQHLISNGLTEKIVARFREIGFLFTTVDIAGFRSGSMNAMLDKERE